MNNIDEQYIYMNNIYEQYIYMNNIYDQYIVHIYWSIYMQCSLQFYALATSKVILEWVPTSDFMGDQIPRTRT